MADGPGKTNGGGKWRASCTSRSEGRFALFNDVPNKAVVLDAAGNAQSMANSNTEAIGPGRGMKKGKGYVRRELPPEKAPVYAEFLNKKEL